MSKKDSHLSEGAKISRILDEKLVIIKYGPLSSLIGITVSSAMQLELGTKVGDTDKGQG